MKQKNFNTQKNKLSESDIDQLVELLGHRCQVRTCQKIRSRLNYSPSSIPSYGILDRLMFDKNSWSYCAGQSYPDEIRTIRNIILNDYNKG